MTASGPEIYQALAIKKGLEFYVKTGMKINRDYTPKNMLATAGKITGQTFRRGDYAEAIKALHDWLEANGPKGEE